MAESITFWKGAPDDIVMERYPAGVDINDIVKELYDLIGKTVSHVAINIRAGRLGVYRPEGYMKVSRARQQIRKGKKNKKPIKLTENRKRNNKGHFVSVFNVGVAADESDQVFQHLIVLDWQDENRKFQYGVRLKRETERLKAAAFFEHQKEKSVAVLAKPKVEKKKSPGRPKIDPTMPTPAMVERAAIARLNARPPVVENTIPTARPDPATKGQPYRMSIMDGPDPLREARLRQVVEGSRGRV